MTRLLSRFFFSGSSTARTMSRDKSDTLLLLLSCALVIAPHASHLPLWVTPVCAVALAWRGWIAFQGKRLPSRLLLAPLAIFAMAAVLATYKTYFGRDAGVAMLTLLLTLKLLEMHARRDLFVALFLSYFLILSGFFYSQSIGTAAITIISLVAILTTQVSFQYTGTVPPLRKRLKLGATILLLAAPLTLALFLLFPRIQGPLWGMPSDATAGHTGLSDSMSPGNISKLALSDDIAFRVKFAGKTPTREQLYWRGIVLSAYDGTTWTPFKTWPLAERDIRIAMDGPAIRYEVTLEPHGKNWIFTLEMPQALPVLQDNKTIVTPEMQVMSTQPIASRMRYDVVSHPGYQLQAGTTPANLRRWLQLPSSYNPRTLEFAQRIRRENPDDTQRVNVVLRHFREQEFRYTLEPPPLGRDSIDDFLFETRAGFCEHYASAFVVLMRAMGIPARVVTGYQGGELNTVDGYMVVRQSDAHAWAEVWLPQRGWVRVDPTAAVAPGRIEKNIGGMLPRPALGGLITLDGSSSEFLRRLQHLRQNWDAVTNAWNQWVLNYNPEKQRNFFKSLGFKEVDWRTMAIVMTVVGVLMSGAIMLPLALQQRKRDPVETAYRLLCEHFAKRGFPRALHEGPREYGRRLASVESPLSAAQKAAVVRFLKLYETARYGRPDTVPPSFLKQLKQLSAECRSFS
jgi:transglutaminase-like putative cysteine protease